MAGDGFRDASPLALVAHRRGQTIHGDRVVVRPANPADRRFVRGLLADFGCEPDVMVIERRADRTQVGVIERLQDEPTKGWLTFGLVAMAEGLRGFGYGSEAVRLLEEWSGAKRFRAKVAKSIGLAFYFWLRQGYRQAGPGDAFWPIAGDSDIIHLIRIPEE